MGELAVGTRGGMNEGSGPPMRVGWQGVSAEIVPVAAPERISPSHQPLQQWRRSLERRTVAPTASWVRRCLPLPSQCLHLKLSIPSCHMTEVRKTSLHLSGRPCQQASNSDGVGYSILPKYQGGEQAARQASRGFPKTPLAILLSAGRIWGQLAGCATCSEPC